MRRNMECSPCLICPKGLDIRTCDDKHCKIWRQWFLHRWDLIHRYPRAAMDKVKREPVGVLLGGKHYASPHQVKAYLQKNPCDYCGCSGVLCESPCRVRTAWDRARKEVPQ